MQSSQENIISISEFNKFLEGKIYRLAPMINFKYHTNAIIALCADEQYLGVATATSHYLYAKSLNSYTVRLPLTADGFGYIEPLVYPGEKIEKIELFIDDSCKIRINNPEGNKIYLYPDAYTPTSGFGAMRPELEITFNNIKYPTEKRLIWIDWLYLQGSERTAFFGLVEDVPTSSGTNNTNAIKETEKNMLCPICSEYSIFLDRGLCSQGHTY